jgi:hypothetical protein
MCWFRNSGPPWERVKHVAVPAQACLLNNHFFTFTTRPIMCMRPIRMAARSKVWVCGHSLAEFAGSNTVGDVGVCLLCALCFVR